MKPRITERRNAFDHARVLPNFLNTHLHGAMVGRICTTVALVLSCSTSSAQALEDAQTQYNRGTDYWYGRGVPQNYVEAANWFRKAAERGYADAQYRLGEMLA